LFRFIFFVSIICFHYLFPLFVSIICFH
jgi:hypothetical protein